LVAGLREELDGDLLAVWLYGSRARDEAEGDSPVYYSLRIYDADWLSERRRIRSFFLQEVDRDKRVLFGGTLYGDGIESSAA